MRQIGNSRAPRNTTGGVQSLQAGWSALKRFLHHSRNTFFPALRVPPHNGPNSPIMQWSEPPRGGRPMSAFAPLARRPVAGALFLLERQAPSGPPSLTTAAVIHAGSGVFGTIVLSLVSMTRDPFGSRLYASSRGRAGGCRRLAFIKHNVTARGCADRALSCLDAN